MKKIIVGHNEKEPLSIEQAHNKLDEKKKELREGRYQPKLKNAKASLAHDNDKLKFLQHCINLLKVPKEKIFIESFIVLCRTFDKETAYKKIAQTLFGNDDVKAITKVKNIEKDILNKISDLIESNKKNKIPIVGGV